MMTRVILLAFFPISALGNINDIDGDNAKETDQTNGKDADLEGIDRHLDLGSPFPNCTNYNDYNNMRCNWNSSCIYGNTYNVNCEINNGCHGNKTVVRQMSCRFCYQTDEWEHSCNQNPRIDCVANATPPQYIKTNCTVHETVSCLGNRVFPKRVRCNWTRGYKWRTAFILSVTAGGFGADRFYLGHWEEGIGKLFSFGGLGIWTLIDVILVGIRYVGPSDGSLYI